MKKVILIVASLFFVSISYADEKEKQKQFWGEELRKIFSHIQKREYQEIIVKMEKEVWLGLTCSNSLNKYSLQDQKTILLIKMAIDQLVDTEIGEFEVINDKDEPEGVTLIFHTNCKWGFFFRKQKQDAQEKILIVGIFTPLGKEK